MITFYGINSAHTNKQMANAMLDWVGTTKNEFRRRNPFAAVTIVGDINAAKMSSADTDTPKNWGLD